MTTLTIELEAALLRELSAEWHYVNRAYFKRAMTPRPRARES
jgi:hypothetical protein